MNKLHSFEQQRGKFGQYITLYRAFDKDGNIIAENLTIEELNELREAERKNESPN